MGAPDMRGIGFLVVVGLIATVLAVLVGPPLIVYGIAWLAEARLPWGLTARDVGKWTQIVWVVVLVSLFGWDHISEMLRVRRLARENSEFMALRDRFYRRDQMCFETLAGLRRRAARADQEGYMRE